MTRDAVARRAGTLRVVVPDEGPLESVPEQDPVDDAIVGAAHVSTVLVVPESGPTLGSQAQQWIAVFAPNLEAIRTWLMREEARQERHDDPGSEHVPRDRHLTIDARTRLVRWGNQRVPVTDLEYRLLETLAADRGRAVSFSELRTSAWGEGPELKGDIFALRSAIQRLRRKLRQAGAPPLLEAVRGFGFRLVEPDPDRR